MLISIVVAFLVLAVLGTLIWSRLQGKGQAPGTGPQQREDRPARARQGRREARRRRRVRNNEESSDEDGLSENEEEEEDVANAAEAETGARQQRINAYEERRRQRDAEREAKEEEEAAERARRAEERRKQEEEEAQKWAEFITIEDQGEVEENVEQDLLEKFVETIQQRKIVVLEELAAEFGIRTQEVIQRIHDLESSKRLTGVMDDRGKYLFIPLSEMHKICEYIKSRGRVSIVELASVSHRLVDLAIHR